jgi:N-acetylmuramoyl-L-alanine amidase
VQGLLASYGYGLQATGVGDAATALVVCAFQRHFRPERADGRIDTSTIITLERLLAALPAPRSS